MKNNLRTAFTVLGGGVFLGILADLILREAWGLNIFIFISLFAGLIALFRKLEGALDRNSISLVFALVAISASFLWRDSENLHILSVLAMLVILAALMFRKLGITGHVAGVFHYILGFGSAGLATVFGPLLFLNRDFNSGKSSRAGALFSGMKGLVIAIPILLIFTGLFSSADPRFEAMIDWFVALPGVEFTLEHGLTIGFVSWFFYGYLRGSSAFIGKFRSSDEALDSASTDDSQRGRFSRLFRAALADIRNKFDVMNFDNTMLPKAFTLGFVEVAVIFGLLNLLFMIFVGLQVEYLFGGFQFVQQSADVKLAEYARNGFGELVVVSFLVLPMLLVADWLVRKSDGYAKPVFRILAGTLIALLFIIMASAIQRFTILTGELGYGFTAPRFYALAFIIWLAVIFVWFIASVLTERRPRFAIGMFWIAMIFILGLNAINPDDFIVRKNLSLMDKGREFDSAYPGALGHDAVPTLIEAYPKLSPIQQCEVRRVLKRRAEQLEAQRSFLSWNLSRRESKQALSSLPESFFKANNDCSPSAPDGSKG
jgi:hypothetical protein